MVCARCQREYDGDESRACPHCGAMSPVSRSGAVKRSMVLISRGEIRSVYGSVEEVPEPLRQQLIESTKGLNSATVLIADRRGREEITRAIRNLPGPMQGRLLKMIMGDSDEEPLRHFGLPALLVKITALVLAGGASALIWLAFHFRG